jgi:hypothetical protein
VEHEAAVAARFPTARAHAVCCRRRRWLRAWPAAPACPGWSR